MKRIIEDFKNEIADFVSGRDDLVMIVRGADSDAAATTYVLNSIGDSSTSEIFWTCVQDFIEPTSYVEDCVSNFLSEYETARLIAEEEGNVLPEVPERVISADMTPVQRLRELIVFSREILPTLDGCSVVWSFLPLTITDPKLYAGFMASVWQHEMPFPWCHHVRLIIRDTSPDHIFTIFQGAPRIRITHFDLSPESTEQSLKEAVADDAADMPERVNSALILAGIDFSHQRYGQAYRQYDIAHQYAVATNDPTLAAIALNGAGDVKRAMNQQEESGKYYEAALVAAANSPYPPVPVLHNINVNLANLRHSQNRFAESEVHYQNAADTAYLLREPEQRIENWNKAGEAQSLQGKESEAIETWTNAAIVAGRLGKTPERELLQGKIKTKFLAEGNQEAYSQNSEHIANRIAEFELQEEV